MPKVVEGEVTIICRGDSLTPFLNDLVQADIVIERILWKSDVEIELTIAVIDFKRVVSKLRLHGCKMKIVKKRGLPFLWRQIMRRKFFIFGVIVFIFLLYAMSSFIWRVEVLGTEKIPREQVMEILQKEGIYSGQLKMKIPQHEQLKQRMLEKLPQATWVGIQVEGTRVVITVVEKKGIDQEAEPQKTGPVDLVAKKDAMIIDMSVERGNPLVEVNDMVKQGQVLVSGFYGDPNTPESGKVVGAKGIVLGEAWYDSEVVVPLHHERKVYTGNRTSATVPFIASWMIRNPWKENRPYKEFEINPVVHSLQIGQFQLPVGWIKEEYLETQVHKENLTIAKAEELGIRRARAEVLQTLGPKGRILEENILQRTIKNGKVYLKINFDVVENIAVSKPFLQGE